MSTTTTSPQGSPAAPRRHPIRATLIIVGCIVGGSVLTLGLLAAFFSAAFSGTAGKNASAGHTAPAAGPSAPAAKPSSPPPAANTPAAFGHGPGWTYSDGLTVKVTSAAATTVDGIAAGDHVHAGDPAVMLKIKEINRTSHTLDASELMVDANAAGSGDQLSQVFDDSVSDASGTLAPGQSGAYLVKFDTAGMADSRLNVTVTPGFDYDPALFTGRIGASAELPVAQAAQPAAPAPAYSGSQTAGSGPYLADLAAAGIRAPADWAVNTAEKLEAAWAAGQTEAQTNATYLLPGGIYPSHLAAFNQIVHAHFG